jgi:hypothetical protein
MSKVRTSAYRQTLTPEGLKAIEKGTLNYFDPEMYANFNTEVLEERTNVMVLVLPNGIKCYCD